MVEVGWGGWEEAGRGPKNEIERSENLNLTSDGGGEAWGQDGCWPKKRRA